MNEALLRSRYPVRGIIQVSLLPLREKDRMRGKPHAVRVGAWFPWLVACIS